MSKGRVVSEGSVHEVALQAGLARSVQVRVFPADVERTVSRLSQVPEIATVQKVDSRPGEIRVEVPQEKAAGVNPVAAALISAGIPILSLEVEGATLNDAFLRLTAGTDE